MPWVSTSRKELRLRILLQIEKQTSCVLLPYCFCCLCSAAASRLLTNWKPPPLRRLKKGLQLEQKLKNALANRQLHSWGSNGKTVGSYSFVIDSPPSRRIFFRSLSVLYDRSGVVEKVVHYESNSTVHEGVTGLTLGSPTRQTNWIKKGETTANYIMGLRGPPDLKHLLPDGKVALEWVYAKRLRGNPLNVDTERFDLLVNEQGVVIDYRLETASVPSPLIYPFGINARP